MKKKVLSIIGVTAFAVAMALHINAGLNSSQMDVTTGNVEALAQGESGTGNKGPGETVRCAGIFTGTKKVCKCSNPYDCTESGCS